MSAAIVLLSIALGGVLLDAALRGDAEEVRSLLERGADVESNRR